MTKEAFERFISDEPEFRKALSNVIAALPKSQGDRDKFGVPTELAIVSLLYPVCVFVIRNFGLPWLHETRRYSELWRSRFGAWVDSEYKRLDIDPAEAKMAGEALRIELEGTRNSAARDAWERFLSLFGKDSSTAPSDDA